MRLSTKGRLAVVAMIDVALHRKVGPISLAVLSRRQRISLSYLEQMFADLRRHGLVASTRGPGGGYGLGREASSITVADILFAVDGPSVESRASAVQPDDLQRCATPELWDSLSRKVVEFLDSVHLQKLVDDQIALGVQMHAEPLKRPEPVRTVVKPSRPNAPNSVFELARFGIAS
ncbi:Rrf2 family transcriptional regulator [Variovorax boronicumulans]|jgi:Rrf2 family iron-sulfur cluster assembly transcriptional regulator|uniref:Rrf2 family transcriptional regulator n=1 Tax=Variovorax boronicumulans TaxID=436515 RepID=UPI001C586F51